MIKEHLSVAAIQFEPQQFRKEENIQRLYELAEDAARNGARLIVMPEMATTGYCWVNREEVAEYVETVPGKTTGYFSQLAARYGCYLVVGMPETDSVTDLYYNTAVLIGPEGVIGKHRKTHPYISEPKWAANGDTGHQVFSTPIGNIALLICMDIHFVETARLAGVQKADVICHISNWLAERTPAPYWINRAYENGCYLIESNRWGAERGVQFSGGSCIITPEGEVQAWRDSGDGIIYGVLAPDTVQPSRLAGRRPELYKSLMTQPFLWNPLDFFRLYDKSPLPVGKRSRIAVAQFIPESNLDANLAEISRQACAAAEAGVELLTFPEYSLTGPYQDSETPITRQHPAIHILMQLTARLRIHLIIGFVEKDEKGLCYNSALMISPDGVLGGYRQTHLSDNARSWATAGSTWKTFDLPCGRVGILLGTDLLYPEAGRVLAMMGCDIIACAATLSLPLSMRHPGTTVPHNYPISTAASDYHWLLPRVRAGENNVYLSYANAGQSGLSGNFGPDTFAWPRHETLIFGEKGLAILDTDTSNLDSGYPTNIVRRKDLVTMRQPHYYALLISDAG